MGASGSGTGTSAGRGEGTLCASCAHVKLVHSPRGSIFYLCRLSITHPGFPKYPPQPVRACAGHARATPDS